MRPLIEVSNIELILSVSDLDGSVAVAHWDS